jgi:hypothetical protein
MMARWLPRCRLLELGKKFSKQFPSSTLFHSFHLHLETEVQATYEKALEQEEERITYQRKMLLLSIKKIRERENEMLIQARNSLLNKRVALSENELETMLRSIEKQVSTAHCRHGATYASFHLPSHFKLCLQYRNENALRMANRY